MRPATESQDGPRPLAGALRLFNSLTRRVEAFQPLDPKRVTVYACGPTVYNHVHIGNWSTFLAADVLVRWLRETYRVVYVQNITDVEDKIIRDSQAEGVDRATFTARWSKVYLDGLEALDCRAAIDHLPLATDHVDGMVEMIQALLDRGHAYQAEDASIYYRIGSFANYGQLAHLDPASLLAGASGRAAADEYDKEQVADFALWKAWTPGDGDVVWRPTFRIAGRSRVLPGRPGWHIECSAMIKALLGSRIDIHMGGEDLLFPHHQNEIAQTEAATGETPFVGVWLHRRFLRVDGGKMSKSRGTFHTLADLEARDGPGAARAFRYLVVTAHYRHAIDFSFAGLDQARAARQGLVDARARFAKQARGTVASSFAAPYETRFAEAMNDDLAASPAIAAIHEAVGEANRRARDGSLADGDAASLVALLDLADRVLGLGLVAPQAELEPAARALLDERMRVRAARDFAAADRLRDRLRAEHGIDVKDTAAGQEWTKSM